MESFGDSIYKIVDTTRGELFNQGKMAQLTYQAYDKFYIEIDNFPNDTITISQPVGYKPTKEVISSEITFTKEELKQEYQYLGLTQLPINGIYNIVTLIEAMFTDLLRAVILRFPKKINSKKQIDIATVLSSESLLDIQLNVINKILNELAYKSPEEFVIEFKQFTSINLLETPAFHRYKEIKATRDIYIHNRGVANEIYIRKADSHSRTDVNQILPVDINYFLESYEYCLQLCEFLEVKLNDIWLSQKFEVKNTQSKIKNT